MIKQKVSLVKCGAYESSEVGPAVKRAVDLLGGIGNFVKPGESVLLKPNLLTDAVPESCIDTHPEVVRAVIRLLKPVTKNIFCGDSPSVFGDRKNVDRVYEQSGMKKMCAEEGVELAYFIAPKLARGIPLTDWLDRCDRLISIPKFKTHGLTVLTAGVKNLFGLVVGMYKMQVHLNNPKPEDLSRILVDVYETRKPDLTVLDGIRALEGEGPGAAGALKQMDLVAASSDALALDQVLALVVGLRFEDIPTIREAMRRGLGAKDIASLEVLGEDWKSFAARGFLLPKATSINSMPRWLADRVKHIFWMRPGIITETCRVCGTCMRSCPTKAIRKQDERVVIDYAKCISCLCCQEICPQGAVAVRRSFIWNSLKRLQSLKMRREP